MAHESAAVAPPRGADWRSAVAAYLLAAVLVTTGTWHFASPHGFESIVPKFLGAPWVWVAVSGVVELSCALGLVIARTRRLAGWACAVLFVAVFPANVQMAVDALRGHGSVFIAVARLPLQIPLVLWAVWIARHTPGPAAR
jgi:uncharacterized membrane protein